MGAAEGTTGVAEEVATGAATGKGASVRETARQTEFYGVQLHRGILHVMCIRSPWLSSNAELLVHSCICGGAFNAGLNYGLAVVDDCIEQDLAPHHYHLFHRQFHFVPVVFTLPLQEPQVENVIVVLQQPLYVEDHIRAVRFMSALGGDVELDEIFII
jgi:hypothetical protein